MNGFEEDFKAFMRQQRAGNRGSARDMLRLLGLICLGASGAFWYPVQWTLVTPMSPAEMVIAVAFGTFLVLGPPVLLAFFVPWSPAAQLLVRINAKTLGQAVAMACALYLLYYAYQILVSWWASRTVVSEAGLVNHQVIIGIIATIVTPALLWAPMSAEEMEEVLRQEAAVKRYELQAQLDIAYLQSMVLEAQRASAAELAGLAAGHAPEIAERMRWLLGSIDQTIGEIAHTYKQTAGTVAQFPALRGRGEVIHVLDSMGDMLTTVQRSPRPMQEAVVIEADTSRSPAPAPPAQPQAATGSPGASGSGETWREAYATARRAGSLVGAWRRSELEQALSIRETQAGDYIRAWEQAGLVERLTEPKWHYRWRDA